MKQHKHKYMFQLKRLNPFMIKELNKNHPFGMDFACIHCGQHWKFDKYYEALKLEYGLKWNMDWYMKQLMREVRRKKFNPARC